jgi:hypothetical protein
VRERKKERNKERERERERETKRYTALAWLLLLDVSVYCR